MGASPAPVPCLLTHLGGSFFRVNPGVVSLALADIAGNTDFDCAHCVVRNVSVTPSVAITVTCAAKKLSFTAVGATKYSVQLVFAQIPAVGSQAWLTEDPCGQELMIIDSTNVIQNWSLQP